MITLRRSHERGHANHGWLDSYHSFSFADYHDPNHMGFGPLRVINEDVIAPGGGFGMHPHHDMEIVTYLVSGSLEHRDSLGNAGVIRRGEIQRMTAGTGITHSEFNPSATEPAHLLQIWIRPSRKGLPPSYEQKSLGTVAGTSPLQLIASPSGRDHSVRINQETEIHTAFLAAHQSASIPDAGGRKGWIQVIEGNLNVLGQKLGPGDALAFEAESGVTLEAVAKSEALIFLLPQ